MLMPQGKVFCSYGEELSVSRLGVRLLLAWLVIFDVVLSLLVCIGTASIQVINP